MANKLYLTWPSDLPKNALKQFKLIHKGIKPLADLNASQWYLTQNPDFNGLIVVLDNNDVRLVRKWINKLQLLGQADDFILSFGKTDILLVRPVCTAFTATEMTLHYLHNGVQINIM